MEKIPFDEVAFRNGATAINSLGDEITFKKEFCGRFWYEGYDEHKSCSVAFAKKRWTMKPSPTESPWVKWDGGECPIPWGKPCDAEIKFRSGKVDVVREYSLGWRHLMMNDDIVAFRLTDGWIYVPGDGTIPEGIKGAKAGEWEVKFRAGYVNTAKLDPGAYVKNLTHQNGNLDIVAVRRVRKEERPATQCKFCDTPIDNEEGIVGDVCCDVCDENYEYISPMGENELPVCAALPETFNHLKRKEQETPQQARNRAAYLRYKAAHPDQKPAPSMIGEDNMTQIAAAALREHDKVWPRKRKLCVSCGVVCDSGLCDPCNSELPF